MVMGTSKAYVVPSWVYHSCENVVSPLNNPKLELAESDAAEPSSGMVRV